MFAARIDLVVVSAYFGNEAGYYIAHKKSAQIVLYFTGQVKASMAIRTL